MDFINLPILIFAILLCLAILTSVVSLRAGIPLILIFLCLGVVTGTSGFEILEPLQRPKICFFVGSLALAFILFDSGFQTDIRNYRIARKPALILATLGVVATAGLMTPFVYMILDIDWIPSFLLASIISSTDAAAVFFLLRSRGLSLREKVKATLEVESGANDPMAIFLTIACITLLQYQTISTVSPYQNLLTLFVGQALIGGGMGYLLGQAIRFCVNHLKLESALYPIFVIGLVLMGFSVTNILGGSGFLAVYLAGLLSGNGPIQSRSQIARFQQTVTLFTCLGLFVTLSGLRQYWQPALFLGFLLTVVARPLMTWAILSFFRSYSAGEKTFISFVGLRGATSILLALMPIVYGLDLADAFFNIIFIMVLLSLSIQGFLIPMAARLCHVVIPKEAPDDSAIAIDLPGLVDSSLILYQLTEKSPAVQGVSLPRWAIPSLVVRNGIAYFSGSALRRLKAGDKVYVFSPSVGRRNLLDHFYGDTTNDDFDSQDIFGDFPISPNMTFGDLVHLYGVHIPDYLTDQRITDFMQSELTDLEVGDRLSLNEVELVVRDIKDNHLESLGLDIDPKRQRRLYTKTHHLAPKND